MDLRLTVGGNVEGGWMVDIHDGTVNGLYRPEASTGEEAGIKALLQHAEACGRSLTPASSPESADGEPAKQECWPPSADPVV